uniref:Uncharacterized protein n=1 Tax=Rhizophora mucronata TaxID=61149 RepID=A0A2P2PNK3_RHIMU
MSPEVLCFFPSILDCMLLSHCDCARIYAIYAQLQTVCSINWAGFNPFYCMTLPKTSVFALHNISLNLAYQFSSSLSYFFGSCQKLNLK